MLQKPFLRLLFFACPGCPCGLSRHFRFSQYEYTEILHAASVSVSAVCRRLSVAAAFCGFFVPGAIVLATKIFNLEQAAREDKTAKFILAAVALFVVLSLLTLIPVKEAFY